jgi:hypothetical protein
MKAVCLAIVFIAVATSSWAQTGQDLLKLCESKNAIESMSCELYISGFVHGMQSSQDLQGTVCLPPSLTGNDATEIFVRTLHDIAKAALQGNTAVPAANPFFTEPQNAALAASLGMKFRCPAKKGDAK